MKKKDLSSIFTFAVIIATSYEVNKHMQRNAGLSDMVLKNIEALAAGNVSGVCRTTIENTESYCFYRCCVCDALHQSPDHGDNLESVSGVCGVCGTPVSSCK